MTELLTGIHGQSDHTERTHGDGGPAVATGRRTRRAWPGWCRQGSLARLVAAVLAAASPASAQEIEVRVDPRVELFGVLFRLAGRSEYDMTRVQTWGAAVDERMGAHSSHPAVQATRTLATRYRVGFFVPMNLAVHVGPLPELAERTPFDRVPSLHATWRTFPDSTAAYLHLVRAFARDADFAGFMAEHAALIDTTETRVRRRISSEVDAAWLAAFWGEAAGARFVIVPGLLNGRASYGVEYAPGDGVREIYAITGVNDVDADGLPRFGPAFARVVVHEYSHSHANPLIDQHRAEFATFGDALYASVAERMRAQAYGTWESMLNEALVRAVVIRYLAAHEGEAVAAEEIRNQIESGFVWSKEFDALLQVYESDRSAHPSMRAFMPRIVEFLRKLAPD